MPDPVAVNSMFARIARRYDLANQVLSAGLDARWRRRLVKAVAGVAPADVLDLATGSGDVAFALRRGLPANTRIVGMDFCQPMLDQANAKKDLLPVPSQAGLTFQPGDGLALPLPDACFDAVTISFGLRNMADRHRSLCEMNRILRPGGHLFVLEFSQPRAWARPMYFFYLRHLLPLIAGAITGDCAAYEYLSDSIGQFPGWEALADEIRAAGFRQVTCQRLACGSVALHVAAK